MSYVFKLKIYSRKRNTIVEILYYVKNGPKDVFIPIFNIEYVQNILYIDKIYVPTYIRTYIRIYTFITHLYLVVY